MTDISQKIVEYFRPQKEVVAVYLFGSYALGKYRPFSDIDIGILYDDIHEDLMLSKRNTCLVELGRILRRDIHPVILNMAGEEILRQIFSKGRCLLINDEKKHAYKKMIMFVKMTDFSYYRKQIQAGLIKDIMEDSNHG
ncbi:putative DNA polymerase beta domain protein region [uncultured Desulfobacterium sp.]|uniref:Putative DNA polymerase beta domain protein region n=1 Tax=uncultured Desulfobacterium sp. TaxID=201089 RepID=A0A445MXU1_9BACT|nr:putative DNA polymerase beta domain protein region [uncultured Desulfobacterium sp.]